jgi:hypothetical protein
MHYVLIAHHLMKMYIFGIVDTSIADDLQETYVFDYKQVETK